jgi:D-glycero-alpha-D-manno-heptose-7-phosphate kinase
MAIDLFELLKIAEKNKQLPTVIAYNRIDGPGSSLDLREFQQSFWTLPQMPTDINFDQTMGWSRNLPRTVGITINTGTKIEAHPYKKDFISVNSVEYKSEVFSKHGQVLPSKENWLLKILDIFGLSGVSFVLNNLQAGTRSAGLGGSATAATGVCILANELAGRPFSNFQLIALASRMEQDMGVSITGTQEQSNTIFGGVRDYIWFPWGIPGHLESGFGMSIQSELISPDNYNELEKRIVVFHSGIEHSSSDVNSVWRAALLKIDGYKLHKLKLEIAYLFREGLRLTKWNQVLISIRKYRDIRTKLCEAYMDGAREILSHALDNEAEAFPLGAGAGGGILVFSPNPASIDKLKQIFKGVYREIPIKIMSKGHELFNITPK